MATYAAAFDAALATFDNLGARAELPRLMHDLVRRGVEAGHGDDRLTALVEVLGGPRHDPARRLLIPGSKPTGPRRATRHG